MRGRTRQLKTKPRENPRNSMGSTQDGEHDTHDFKCFLHIYLLSFVFLLYSKDNNCLHTRTTFPKYKGNKPPQ